MTAEQRNQVVNHWINIVEAVFVAEEVIQKKHKDMLSRGDKLSQEDYCREVAEELLSVFKEEDIEQSYFPK